MPDLYESLYRHVATRIDAERAHDVALIGLHQSSRIPGGERALGSMAPAQDERLRLRLWGIPFANPVGIAAGLDKNAVAVEALVALGYGHVEIGTVTLRPQPGNAKPRLWRITERDAVINAMGFPSHGAATVRSRMIRLRPHAVIGINIGKNRDTPLNRAADDYAGLVSALFDIANYFTVNVSSPNTPGLRDLQRTEELAALLARVQQSNQLCATLHDRNPKPVLIKIAPDLDDREIEEIADAAIAGGASGIIATNTTASRDGVPGRYADYPGGVSGLPLRDRANEVVRILYRRVGDRVPIVGVGGIMSGADALERIRSGATLVQVYTGFTYHGPGFGADIVDALMNDADRHGWSSVSEIVGIHA